MEETAKRWDQDKFVERLMLLMTEANDSTYKLGKVIGCDASTITRWLMKDTVPRVAKIDKLASYYDVNPFWLMGGEQDRDFRTTLGSGRTDAGEPDAVYETPFDLVYETTSDDDIHGIPVGAKVSVKEGVLVRNGEIALVELPSGARCLRRVLRLKSVIVLFGDGGSEPGVYTGDTMEKVKIIGKAMTVSFIPK